MKILCIDFDDVIFKTKPRIEEIVKTIEYYATEEYLNSIIHDNSLDLETQKILRMEHFEYKDRVLEEVDDKYKNRIDYDKIFETNEIYPHTIEYIRYLCNCGKFDKVYILTHCNVDREINAKRKFINKYLPGLEIIPVFFHKDKYEPGKKRKPTSKAEALMEYLGISDISNCTLIDDSANNGYDWRMHGGNFIKYAPTSQVSFNEQIVPSLNPFGVNLMSDTVLKLEDGQGKVKR